MNQLYVHIYPLLPGPPSSCIPSIMVTTEPRAEFPVLWIRFLLAVYLTHNSVLGGEGNGNPLQYSCLENPMDRGAWWTSVHGVTQSRTRLKWLSMHACIGEGRGNSLQYSCLENPRARGAWWAAVYGVAQSRTGLKRLSSSSSSSSVLGLPQWLRG